MKKISFKNLSNDEILTRDELKRIIGGNGSGGFGDYPGCLYIGKGENSSCWYVSSQESGDSLCQRVYGGDCDYVNGPSHCNDYCIMN